MQQGTVARRNEIYNGGIVMAYILRDKIQMINDEIGNVTTTNPIEAVEYFMNKNYINIHGPEHHYLDGAAFLVAYRNAGGEIDLQDALVELRERTMKMPGAMCGQWGVCGSTAAIGACLAIIHGTSPLSDNEYYKDNMEYTSETIALMSRIGGPRCCKRNAFISLINGAKFVEKKYGIKMEIPTQHKCSYSFHNHQCIGMRCPFH